MAKAKAKDTGCTQSKQTFNELYERATRNMRSRFQPQLLSKEMLKTALITQSSNKAPTNVQPIPRTRGWSKHLILIMLDTEAIDLQVLGPSQSAHRAKISYTIMSS